MLDSMHATFYQRGSELDRRCEALAEIYRELRPFRPCIAEVAESPNRPQYRLWVGRKTFRRSAKG